jgi:PRC-barrel domain
MQDTETVRTWQGRTLLDRDGSRIGTIDALYLDDRTGQPEWALVNTGLFGTESSFVPLAQAFQSDNDVLVSYDKQLVMDAPRIDPDQRLSEAEERQLWQHYGLDYEATDRSVATLQVRTTQRERGRVRLRKYVIT